MHHPGPWPFVLIAVMWSQRLVELSVSARHVRRLRAIGAREYGRGHFPLIVAVHVLFPFLLVLELTHHGTGPAAAWPWWLAAWLSAQVLRYSAVHALGERWNVLVMVVPGMPLVRSGPYRWVRHPNYIAIVLEFIAAPMMFGAWRTAIVIGALNALALTLRIRCENRALQRAAVDSSSR